MLKFVVNPTDQLVGTARPVALILAAAVLGWGRGSSRAAQMTKFARPECRFLPRNFQTRPGDPAQAIAALRCGMVIAATPMTTQARPIQTVGLRLSPRNTTLAATPIGTRK